MVNISEKAILSYLKQRCKEDWLRGYDSYQFYGLTESYLQKFKDENPANVFLLDENCFNFLAAFLAGIVANIPVFLAHSHWKDNEWQQVLEVVEPDLIIGESQLIPPLLQGKWVRERSQRLENTSHLIMIPTGGTSGKIRFVVHSWQTLTASVKGLYHYFEVKNINSFCILPLYHVSGLMQFLRSFLTEGHFFNVSYTVLKNEINNESFREYNFRDFFISLVPTQLQFLLDVNPSWLSQFHTVLLGGAPAWPALLEQAREYKINLAPTYGMTETASQIVTLKPSDFLKGNNSTGQVLPHAKITLSPHGVITVESESLFLGYYGQETHQNQIFYTDDIGQFDESDYLYILGRNSQKIISGGENIYPAEIEAVILGTKLVKDVAVIGFPDTYWGEIAIAIYVLNNPAISPEILTESCRNQLSQYKCPKYWIRVDSLPRNSQGKLNHQQLREIVSSSRIGILPVP